MKKCPLCLVQKSNFTKEHLPFKALYKGLDVKDNPAIIKICSDCNQTKSIWDQEILDDAVSLIGEWQYEIPWFPSEEKLRNDEFYVYPWSIYCHGVKPSSVQLIFLKPDEKMVYYISVKM